MNKQLIYADLEDMTEDMLNDTYRPIEIVGIEYEAGRALRKLDPIAFREVVNDYIDSMLTDGVLKTADSLDYDYLLMEGY